MFDWFKPPPRFSDDESATRLQCAWRRFQAIKKVASMISYLNRHVLINKILDKRTKRQKIKMWVAARNQRIRYLQKQLGDIGAYFSNWGAIGSQIKAKEEMDSLIKDPNNHIRAATLVQSWWRGCRARGIKIKRKDPGLPVKKRRRSSLVEEWMTDVGDKLKEQTDKWDKDNPCYPWTKVRKYTLRKVEEKPATNGVSSAKRVVILFSDTGGGHRASAESLVAAFAHLYGDKLKATPVDLIVKHCPWPWNNAPDIYKVLAKNPGAWEFGWKFDNGRSDFCTTDMYKIFSSTAREMMMQFFVDQLLEGLDMVISVHPLLNHIPYNLLMEIGEGTLPCPLATVVTDLGSAHLSWFEPRCNAIYVPGDAVEEIAKFCQVSQKKLFKFGLPIRKGFWLPDPVSKHERRKRLDLPVDGPIALVMGGGDGMGSLAAVAKAIGARFAQQGNCHMVLVCGRNAECKAELEEEVWPNPNFKPTILGFINNVDEYMTACDCMVTKAGPGSIAEAMVKGLPCLLTSFLPGQEEGNVDYVVDGGVGKFVEDTEPEKIAEVLTSWMADPKMLADMGQKAFQLGSRSSTIDICRSIGSTLLDLGDGAKWP